MVIGRLVGVVVAVLVAFVALTGAAAAAPPSPPVPGVPSPVAPAVPGALARPAAPAAPTPTPTPSPSGTGIPGVLQNPVEQGRQDQAIRDHRETERALNAARNSCKRPPTPSSPREGIAGALDTGPTAPTGSDYSRLGWGGYGLVMYDPGCGAGNAWLPRVSDGANAAAASLLWVAVTLAGATVALVRMVTSASGVLDAALTPILNVLGVTVAPIVFGLTFLIFAALATIIIAWAARKRGALAYSARYSGGMIAIVIVAATCIAWSAAAVSATTGMTRTVFPAVGEVVAGGQPVDVVIGDMFQDGVITPLWAQAQLNDDSPEAIAVAKQLRAASTFTRDEKARIEADPTQDPVISAQKITDYVAAAKSWQEANPARYDAGLAGNDTGYRLQWAATALIGMVLIGGPLLAALIAWVVLAVLLELVPRIFPIVAGFLLIPAWQHHAADAGKWVVKWLAIGVGGLVVFIAWSAVTITILGQTDLPLVERFGAIAVLVAVIVVAWKTRVQIVRRLGVADDLAKALRVAREARDRVPGVRRKAGDHEQGTDAGSTKRTRTTTTTSRPAPAPELTLVSDTAQATRTLSDTQWEKARRDVTTKRRRVEDNPVSDERRDVKVDVERVYRAQQPVTPTNASLVKIEVMEHEELSRRAHTHQAVKSKTAVVNETAREVAAPVAKAVAVQVIRKAVKA